MNSFIQYKYKLSGILGAVKAKEDKMAQCKQGCKMCA